MPSTKVNTAEIEEYHMLNFKKKIGLGAAGIIALGGSVFGVALSSGIASASGNTTTVPSNVTVPGVTNTVGDSGSNVESGLQTGSQSTAPDASEGASSDATSSEATTLEVDGVGGPQGVSGLNVDSQTTGAQ
ncbi:MAG: hypothetical protein ACYC19_05500 [Acidimicrobiales bacterium]